jgi:hypothetical protein
MLANPLICPSPLPILPPLLSADMLAAPSLCRFTSAPTASIASDFSHYTASGGKEEKVLSYLTERLPFDAVRPVLWRVCHPLEPGRAAPARGPNREDRTT